MLTLGYTAGPDADEPLTPNLSGTSRWTPFILVSRSQEITERGAVGSYSH